MKYLNTPLIVIIMVSQLVAHAQEKIMPELHWRIRGRLPASEGQVTPLGFAGPVAGIYHDAMIVAGGANFPNGMPWQGGKKKYYDDVYVYKWQKEKLVRQRGRYKLAAAIAYAAICSTPGGIIYAGGESENGISNKVISLQWNAALKKVEMKNLPDLPVALTNAGAALCNNTMYIAGGEMIGGVSDKLFCLNLENISAGWKEMTPVPVKVSHMVMVASLSGNPGIYLIGGRKKNEDGISTLYTSVHFFDTEKSKWTEKKSLPYPLTAGTGIALGTDIILFGGDTGNDFHEAELLAAKINTETDGVSRQRLLRKKNQLQAAHPGFSKQLLMYNIATDNWRNAGDIPFPAQVTTTALKWDKHIIIPGGEIRAGVRTPAIVSATVNQ